MMSNCAFWSESGELLAVHGAGAEAPEASFGPWAASRRLKPGRLIPLSSMAKIEAKSPGWQTLSEVATRRIPRAVSTDARIATPAPALDEAATRLLPPRFDHEKFTLRSWPTWTCSVTLAPEESSSGWWAGLGSDGKTTRYLLRLIPHRGRLPGEGWRNMLAWSIKARDGIRLAPLPTLPTAEVLARFAAWEYRVEAGQGDEAAAWDVQVIPSKGLLAEWVPGVLDPWEATALLRWQRPSQLVSAPEDLPFLGEPKWADLFSRLPVPDARLLVQNVLTTLPGGASEAAALFYQTIHLAGGEGGRSLVRHVAEEGLPEALLSTLYSRRAWREVERAKRYLPSEGERRERRSESLADLDLRLLEGRLPWSAEATALWDRCYRQPRDRAMGVRLASYRNSDRWKDLLAGDHRVAESLLRGLDVTDVALCLRDAPDKRWRRFVTARREAELNQELEFCRIWEARGDLPVARELDAWECWDQWLADLPLTEGEPGNYTG